MFVMTAKLSKPKLIAAGVVLLAAILLIVLLAMSDRGNLPKEAPMGGTNEERIAYLATFGWSVNAEPKEAQNVRIPDTGENEVFSRYNELQRSQGFDLSGFAGKEVMRYVYEILNYPDAAEPVYATLLVHEGKIIGGDITDTAPEGLIHGFEKPAEDAAQGNTAPMTEASTAPATEASTEPAPTEAATSEG